ncbi:probable polygalacturonase At1g80170 [Rutidosis leptorrhynchoides]|uniref:probable polygalacturonase At1g80170 n=1 Tax=Rutidosis leptorrhynchoides TaxID=125765 RepID=UPI003A99BF9D
MKQNMSEGLLEVAEIEESLNPKFHYYKKSLKSCKRDLALYMIVERKKMISSSSSPSDHKFVCKFVCIIIYSVFLFSISINVQAFDSLLHRSSQFWGFNNFFESRIVLNVKDYGAVGDGIKDDTKVFADVWDIACSSEVESTIIIPAECNCLVGPISFGGPCNSNVTLMIYGSIVAPSDPDVWNGNNTQKWLYFHNVDHLKVDGGGIIDGMGQEWWASSCKRDPTNPCRHAPTAISFHRCNDLTVRNLMIVNGQQMQMAFTTCDGVTASRLTVFAPAGSPNTDGIHISASTNVKLKDTTVRTGDDCISIVSNSSKVQVRNIFCGPGHGISIGSLGESGTCDQVYDISVYGAFLSNTDNGLRIKTWQGGSGFVNNVKFENIWMENVSNPIIIDQYYCDKHKACPNKTCAVNVNNISFVNVKGTSVTKEAIIFACSDVSPCEGLYLEDIELVSPSGGITTSYCWEANVTTSSIVYPPTCVSPCRNFIDQIIASTFIFKPLIQCFSRLHQLAHYAVRHVLLH